MRISVVVPARDEETTIGACLDALAAAARHCPVPVDVVVVADRCQDRTERIARAAGVRVLLSGAGQVGAARAAGVRAARALRPVEPADEHWIASTDADSLVPAGWLGWHAQIAAADVDLLLGTVRLAGPAGAHRAWRERYAAGEWATGHVHVHGANLGVRASTYLAAGGFPALPAHEDRALADRVRALPGARVLASSRFPVTTSDRLVGRAPEGVAADLSA
ncbi:glycosyltransferase [Kineococcus rhizosphaerae]|uniref:4,4'-diaponeurosporenoate glycosyltransferase n=1 Tax=Kineococcus rhizosphaerae TaxID=559628 RepID=A0A2T0R3F6_9ACTN|nr:glycosyltransferase [Kineococcus rhizosphaerae]PRY14551.1 glycosyl transferase family 2 [Kineococcus rhizosphaerae]